MKHTNYNPYNPVDMTTTIEVNISSSVVLLAAVVIGVLICLI